MLLSFNRSSMVRHSSIHLCGDTHKRTNSQGFDGSSFRSALGRHPFWGQIGFLDPGGKVVVVGALNSSLMVICLHKMRYMTFAHISRSTCPFNDNPSV